MKNTHAKINSLTKVIDEGFSDIEIKTVLVTLLLHIYKDDELEAIKYLEKVREKI